MVNTLGAVFSPKSKIGASHLSGPVGIANLYYNLFKHPDGWRLVIWFSVVLNINLAILNMLPFPVLDGGHITMAILETFRRKPLNTRALEVVQGAAFILLFGLHDLCDDERHRWFVRRWWQQAARDQVLIRGTVDAW